MRIDDWRNLSSAAMQPVYEVERLRWANGLQWDLAPSLRILERARGEGTLPGLVVRGPGQSVVGWTYFVLQQGVLQVGALHARTADGVRLLLDAIVMTPEASLAHDVLLFVYPDSPACESALLRRRFTVTRYWYLRRAIERLCAAPADPALRPLCDCDGPDVVRLFSRAYAGERGARCFAPHGRLEEWAHYVGQLTRGAALGQFLPEASLVMPGSGLSGPGSDSRPCRGQLAGASIVTSISARTLHLAQIIVDPQARRQRVASRMLDGVLSWGLAHDRAVATLLVSEHNAHARALYDARGFVQTGCFLHAERPIGRRVLVAPIAALA